jgi:recombination protein RecA
MATKRKPRKAAKKKQLTANIADLMREAQLHADEGTFHFYSDTMFVEPAERLSTGVLGIDRITRGGWPIGKVSEIAAWEQVGKSTLLDQSIGRAQALGADAVLVDSEHARDPTYMRTLGVDLDKLVRIKAETIEKCFTAFDQLLDGREALLEKGYALKPLLIVWDSIGGTPTKAQAEGAADARHMMDAARVINMNLQRLTPRLPVARAALVCANHFYMDPGPPPRRIVPGGKGLRYFTSYRIWLTRKGPVKVGTSEYGHQVEAVLKKDRFGQNTLPTMMGVLQGRGFDNTFTLFEWCRETGSEPGHQYVDQRGAWYTFSRTPDDPEPVKFQRGFLGFHQLVAVDQPELYEKLAAEYLQS